jgi:O-antigen/teichoic acid export membrane protein
MISKKTDSLKKRYLFKLLANFAGLVISSITGAIIPRGLGPKAYGDFNYLTNFFLQIVGFFDMGTSIGFFTKISSRQKEIGLVSFYRLFSMAISLVIIIFVFITTLTPIHNILWPDQRVIFIYFAAIWGIITWFGQILNKMGDAYGLTVSIELARILQKILGLAIILPLFFINQITLRNFFFIIIYS